VLVYRELLVKRNGGLNFHVPVHFGEASNYVASQVIVHHATKLTMSVPGQQAKGWQGSDTTYWQHTQKEYAQSANDDDDDKQTNIMGGAILGATHRLSNSVMIGQVGSSAGGTEPVAAFRAYAEMGDLPPAGLLRGARGSTEFCTRSCALVPMK
jgi:hypothetical protein